MNCLSKRNRTTTITNWRQAKEFITNNQLNIQINDNDQTNGSTSKPSILHSSRRRNLISTSNFVCALLITIVIILTQLFIVHHYVGDATRRHRLFNLKGANRETDLLAKSSWFCHGFSHLNRIAQLAHEFQVELVIVDPNLLGLLVDDEDDEATPEEGLEFSFNGKMRQEAGRKTIVHLAAINETSGGQPNLKLFYTALKEHYHMLKYNDASETMAAEVYRRQPHQLDDVQLDAMQDSRGHEEQSMQMAAADFEISKIYTEFISHVLILNATQPADSELKKWAPSRKCLGSSAGNDEPEPFIAVHLFVLYNYEFQPDDEWIQSSLLLDEIDRHKLLAYGVHSIDFRVPLDHYYIHKKRRTASLLEASSFKSPLKPDRPMNKLKILEPNHWLDYANNTYLHCKQSSFNISALREGNRRMSGYLKTLDAAQPLKTSRYRAMLLDQLSIALQFMNVFSKSYGNFSFWLTGSTLLAYHKFCQLIALTQTRKWEHQLGPTTEDDLMLLSIDDYEEQVFNDNTMLEFELGLFESELNSTMLNDLSEANMIGVTMMSDWRGSNGNNLVSFHVKDCPNLVFNLHFYKLKRDFYQPYYVTNDNMIYNHKFRRRKSSKTTNPSNGLNPKTWLDSSAMVGHHVFSTRNLELCWTRLDHLEPFRVPCDVHDHLRRIYVI